MGKIKLENLANLKLELIAVSKGNPYSTIFLIRSNITPTDNEMTVKAEIAKSIGGIICPINHLSIKGIEFQCDFIWRNFFLVFKWFEIFKSSLLN